MSSGFRPKAKEIAKALNRDVIKTRGGKCWGKTTIGNMLRYEVYTGAIVWKSKGRDTLRHPGAHPALVSKEDFHKAQQLLDDRCPKVRHPRTVTSRYLLSSLLYCAGCSTPMIGYAAKSGRFCYYRCNNALRHDPEACRTGWLPKERIETFVVNRLKENVLTDENLAALVRMVNEEVSLLSTRGRERLDSLRYYVAFEKGAMTDVDAAPRIRELREEQMRLQKDRDEALTDLEDAQPKQLDIGDVRAYVKDLKELLGNGTLLERKTFLRSFIKRIDFDPTQVTIQYTIPMPLEREGKGDREVLSLEQNSGPWCTISRTASFELAFSLATVT